MTSSGLSRYRPSVTEVGDEDTAVARAYLSAVAEPPAPALSAFVEAEGALVAAERVRTLRVPPKVADEVSARHAGVSGADLLAAGRAAGARLLVPESPEWPTECVRVCREATAIGIGGLAPPIALWGKGSANLASALSASVSVVGARAASSYGEHVAAELAHGVAAAGWSVVSGAAYGIDGAAHRGALAASGITIAFLACGVDVDYPAGHGRLLRAIAEGGGLVVSEYPPGTRPRKHRFLVRNRLIAAAGLGTVVVEAGARSGAANTAGTADALGRPVMAVPGPVTSHSSVGCHTMIRSSRAVLVTRAEDVVELVAPLGCHPSVDPPGQTRVTDQLDTVSRLVYDALAHADSAEQIVSETGLALHQVRAVLPALELAGMIEFGERGWIRME